MDDIEQKISEMEVLNDDIKQKTVSRGRSLEDALESAKKFWDIYNNLMTGFRDIQDCINSQDSPQVSHFYMQTNRQTSSVMLVYLLACSLIAIVLKVASFVQKY